MITFGEEYADSALLGLVDGSIRPTKGYILREAASHACKPPNENPDTELIGVPGKCLVINSIALFKVIPFFQLSAKTNILFDLY